MQYTIISSLSNQLKQLKTNWANQLKMLAITLIVLACLGSVQVEAGGKGKGNMEDIILYNGNIVMRGDKKGGSIVMANNHHSHHEEVEFSPSFFGFGHHDGDMGHHGGYMRR